eukprot:m.312320 g.312320  ORF g.312320 m.312320 type:complete len:59 (-) comp29989_c0_seq1:233-409(-)
MRLLRGRVGMGVVFAEALPWTLALGACGCVAVRLCTCVQYLPAFAGMVAGVCWACVGC